MPPVQICKQSWVTNLSHCKYWCKPYSEFKWLNKWLNMEISGLIWTILKIRYLYTTNSKQASPFSESHWVYVLSLLISQPATLTVPSFMFEARNFSGFYYKHMTIVNDDSSVINMWSFKLIDGPRVVTYNRHKFIMQATEMWGL